MCSPLYCLSPVQPTTMLQSAALNQSFREQQTHFHCTNLLIDPVLNALEGCINEKLESKITCLHTLAYCQYLMVKVWVKLGTIRKLARWY